MPWSSASQASGAIATSPIDSESGIVIASGATFNFAGDPYSMPGISYQLNVSLFGTLQLPVQIGMNWQTTPGGATIDTMRTTFFPGVSGTPHNVVMRGPCKSGVLRINAISYATANMTLGYTLYNTNVPYVRDDCYTLDISNNTNWAGATPINGFDITSNIVAYDAITVASNNTVSRLMPLYNGRVTGYFATGSGTNDLQLVLQDYGMTFERPGWNSWGVWNQLTGSTGVGSFDFCLPRSQCLLQLTNKNASSRNPGVSIIKGEQPA
jgi:hypothetical protein